MCEFVFDFERDSGGGLTVSADLDNQSFIKYKYPPVLFSLLGGISLSIKLSSRFYEPE